MLFNSGEFCFLFLPVVLVAFYLTRNSRSAIAILGVGSAVFYMLGTPIVPGPFGIPAPPYLLLLLASILWNYAFGWGLRQKPNSWLLAIGVTGNLGALGYFKYANFFIENTNSLFGTSFHPGPIFLPLGISFYTFQSVAYLSDCQGGKVGRHSLLDFSVFLHFFPQLIAGPIVHHREMLPQFQSPDTYRLNCENLARGFALFTFGLAKKVLIADRYSEWVGEPFKHISLLSPGGAWAAILTFALQLYFDFSGYTDMAIGLGLMFNIKYPQNFNSPYKAVSLIDFWRRWHMTLSRFLRDYVYIPLGGNRLGKSRRYLNLIVTMLLGGFWHGAAWTYVLWGAWHGAFLALNHMFEERTGWRIPRPVGWACTFLIVVLGWGIFRCSSFADCVELAQRLAGHAPHGVLRAGQTQWIWLGAGIVVTVFMPNTQAILSKVRPRFWWTAGIILLFVITTYHFNKTTEFLYYQF